MAFVSYQMFDIVRDVLYLELTHVSPTANSIIVSIWHALLGGIIINRFDMDDYFQPLSFEIKSMNKADNKIRSGLKTVNLRETTFGPKPHLKLLYHRNESEVFYNQDFARSNTNRSYISLLLLRWFYF
jgi:hypothetical protein